MPDTGKGHVSGSEYEGPLPQSSPDCDASSLEREPFGRKSTCVRSQTEGAKLDRKTGVERVEDPSQGAGTAALPGARGSAPG